MAESVSGATMDEKILVAYQELQNCYDQVWDINMARTRDQGGQGLKQVGQSYDLTFFVDTITNWKYCL